MSCPLEVDRSKLNTSRLVYSTDKGRICPQCQKPEAQCGCKRKRRTKGAIDPPNDGIIRIRREVKGRKGKTVTTLSGFLGNAEELKTLASKLKKQCGTGGTAKDGVITIQGDHREVIREALQRLGFTAKQAGG